MKNRRYSERLVIAAAQNRKERDYWLNKLSGEPVKSHFPYDSPGKVGEPAVDSLEFQLPDELYKRVMQLSKGSHPAIHLLMVTGLVLLLNKYSYSGNNDIVVAVPIEKQAVDREFVNTVLLLRGRLTDNMTVKQLILEMRRTIAEAIENYNYPVEVLYEQLELPEAAVKGDEDPLVGVGILLENIHDKGYIGRIAPDITFLFSVEENGMRGRVEYRRYLYEKGTIRQISGHLTRLMGEALVNVEARINNISILSSEERKRVLVEFNHSEAGYPRSPSVVELFASQVSRTPDKTALVHENSWLTYNELNSRSGRLACLLRSRGVSPGSIAGLMVKPSFSMLVGIIGVLKAGGAYLPLAPDWPESRVKFMMSDSSAGILLSEVGELSELSGEIDPHQSPAPAGSLVYIIYTSGSTGRPKGVPITHGNLTPLLLWSRDYFGFGEHTRVLQNLSYTFDFGAFELLTTLIFGGTLYFFDRSRMVSSSEYVDFIHRHEIDTLHTTPSFLSSILIPGRCMHTLRILHLGGERLTGKLIRDVSRQLSPECRIYNGYGPTETTINSSIFATGAGVESRYDYAVKIMDNTPIGRPSANNIIFIMDIHMNLLPVGVPGELYIGGGGVAPGYLNRPELTAEKFVFISYKSYRSYRTYFSKKLYKTGDLGCWLADGNIEFLGRIDHQVKIRGLRVELEEIESRLLRYPDVREVLVICRDDYLCAYIVAGAGISLVELRGYLSEELPAYMVPSYFVFMERMPLTASGKVNRKALPDPRTGVTGSEYTPPEGFFEEELVGIWSDLLGIEKEQIGVHADFFQLGGHSLLAAGMAARLHKHFDMKVPLGQILKTPTVRELAKYLKISAANDRYFSIQPVEKKDYYVLSPAQRRMYILQQMDPDGTGYNMPALEVLEGDTDKENLAEIFKKLIQGHESLRTSFHLVGRDPVQRVHEPGEVEFELEYYEDIEKVVRPFDLSYAPLVRIGLLKLEARDHILVVDMHHIISDGISMDLIVKDFTWLNRERELPRLRLQYKDYAEWRNRESQKALLTRQEAHWLNTFAGEIPVLDLPYDYPRPAAQSFAGEAVCFEFGESETRSLYDLARSHGFTLYMVMLAVYYVLLSKLSGQRDIVVGIPVGGRRHADLENIIGMFVNTLALRNDVSPVKTFAGFLNHLGERTLTAFENQEYPFEDLVEKLSVERDAGRNPIFDVMFNWHTREKRPAPRKSTRGYEGAFKISKFDMTLVGIEEPGSIVFTVEYCTKLFKRETIERFIGYFKRIVTAVISDPLREIPGIGILSTEEKNRLLIDFNDTAAEYPDNKSIHQWFADRVERTPHGIAVISAVQLQITYHELNKKADQLAWILNEKGAGIDSNPVVGIMTEPSLEMVTGILGILKAGGAYLPIDPGYPRERIDYMLKDSHAVLLLTSDELSDVCRGTACRALPDQSAPAAPLAYVIYTSGSTGQPKGVMVNHQSAVNLLFYLDKEYPFSAADTYLLKTSYIFDVSVTELFGWFWGEGGRLAILPSGDEKDPGKIVEMVERCGVTHINFVPSMFRVFVDILDKERIGSLSSLKYIFLAGEALPGEIINRFRELNTGIRLENIYGPTEATVYASKYSLCEWEGDSAVSIGKPVQNTGLYILDSYGELQPVGITGELCIAGKGLARGYLNRPELTAERFVFYRSYRTYRTYYSPRIYKTGDLARWQPDGNIEYLGRMDHQVKIRGFRIELAEIENRLSAIAGIKEALVIAKEIKGENCLCAYIVNGEVPGREQKSVEASDMPVQTKRGDIKRILAKKLPAYMIPAYFVRLEKMPLTPAGKIDRKRLPGPEAVVESEYVPPGNEDEKRLLAIWTEVLAGIHRPIGIDDNFFELGGHSLFAAVLAARIHKVFAVKVPLIEIFKTLTVRELARYIRASAKEKHFSIESAETKEYCVLSSAQKRMYILQRMDLESTAYNIPFVEILESGIKKEQLETISRKLIHRHESLRTSFHMVGEGPVQKVHEADEVEFAIEYYDHDLPTAHCQLPTGFFRPFDLSKAPLLRIGLIENFPQPHSRALMVDIHHIISDGVSIQVILDDFTALSENKELPGLRLQYSDYAEWQSHGRQKNYMKKQEAYWLKQFENGIPVLELPYDYDRPTVHRIEGDEVSIELGELETSGLRELARLHGATLFMVLLGAFYVLLAKISGQEEIVVGIPAAGRRHADLESIVGMFVNTLPLMNYPIPAKSFSTFLEELTGTALTAFESQDYPFEDMVEKLPVPRDIGRHPLFDVMFNLQNRRVPPPPSPHSPPDANIAPLDREWGDGYYAAAKFDMTLTAAEVGNRLLLQVRYSTNLFKKETIQRFSGYLGKIISGVIIEPRQKLFQIDILSEFEKGRLLDDFNRTAGDYPRDKTIRQLFEEQVMRSIDGTAVIARVAGSRHAGAVSPDHITITYGELNRRSNRLACLLREKGIKADTAVGILVEPSVEMVIGVMAILKAGGAYLPIDPEYPPERINYLLKDSNAGVLVSESSEVSQVSGEIEVVKPGELSGELPAHFTHPAHPAHPAHLCYIIYTSGTTGKPKGVLVQHNNLVNYVTWFSRAVKLTAADKALLASSFAFDLGYTVFFPPLLMGGQLHLLPKESYLPPGDLLRYIQANGISYIKVTPSFFATIVRDPAFSPVICRPLRLIVLGGERIKVLDVEEAHARCSHIRIMNHYGPSETTIGSAACFIDFTGLNDYIRRPTIGYPVSNTNVYILGKHLELMPTGVPGELCISGAGVARGYLERPALTAKKFTANPYAAGERLYRTGDLARRLENGHLEFLGRSDHQVKIRGYRIEPGEIERRIMNTDTAIIKEALVIDFSKEPHGEKYLCAYLVSPREVKIPGLKEALSKQLPDYMIPSYFLRVEEIPRTPNGKVNKKALPVPRLALNMGETIVPPTGETEGKLVDLWSDVLDLEPQLIGIDSNFFELGGHSLKATVLVSKVHKMFDLQVPLVEIFKRPTIRNLASYIGMRGVRQNQAIHPEPVETKEYYALSLAQERMYRFQRMNPESTELNFLRVEPLDRDMNLDKENLKVIFNQLIHRHEGLRTSFVVVDGEPVQRIHDRDQVEVKVEVKTHSHYSPQAAKDIIQDFVRPFALSQVPLLRIGLIYKEESPGNNQILVVDMHHILSDAGSMNILMSDFRALSGNKKKVLPGLRIHYKDYAEWQNSKQQRESLKKQQIYWLTEFAGDLPVLHLPTDYGYDRGREPGYPFAADKVSVDIEPEKTVFLGQFSVEQDLSMSMVLLAIFSILLAKISGQEDIVVGVPIDCRRHPDLETIIGLFANILALRTQPIKEKTFNSFLDEVKEKSLKAFNNREYPFEDLVEKVSTIKNSGYDCNPLFKVMYNFMAIQPRRHPPEVDTLEGKGTADILLTGIETGENLRIVVEYNAKRFNKETMEKMLDGYLQVINALKKTKGNIKLEEIVWESDLLTLEEVSLDVAFNI